MSYTARDLAKMLSVNPDLAIMGDGTISAPVTNVAMPKLSEHQLQVAIIAECEYRAVTNPDYGLIFAIPNGGHRHLSVARDLKAEGVRPGIPDLCCPIARHSRHALWLELKVGKNQLSPYQEFWVRKLRALGHCVEVVRDDPAKAMEVLTWYLES